MATGALGHGFMFQPAARNYLHDSDNCPHCLQMGGGIYGPAGIQASYAPGQIIAISLLITAQHGGRHMFHICPSTDVNEACFAANILQRADGTGPFTWTPTEPNSGAALPPSGYQPSGTLLGETGQIYTFEYKLPDGLACAACTLQWWWTTTNSCDMDGNPFGAKGMTPCTEQGPFPEEFMNCADISIGAGTPTPLAAVAVVPGAASTQAASATTEPASAAAATAALGVQQPATSEPAVSNPSSGDANAVCQAAGANGNGALYPAPWSCAQFVQCSVDGGHTMSCEPGLVFDPNQGECNYPQATDCGGRPLQRSFVSARAELLVGPVFAPDHMLTACYKGLSQPLVSTAGFVQGRIRSLAESFGAVPDICKRRKAGEPDLAQELGVYVHDWEELRARLAADLRQAYGAAATQPAAFIPTQPVVPQQMLGGEGFDRSVGRHSLRLVKPNKTKGSGSGRTFTSKYRGVHQTFPTKRWEAQFRRSGKPTSLGCFDHEEEAARAYDKMMIWCELHHAAGVKGGITNFDPSEYTEDIPWLQQITQDELVQLLRSDGRRQAAQRMLRQKRDYRRGTSPDDSE
ncbi:hypothetical protein N2152v2_010563 [Parachlorella kessleri]